MLRHSWCFPIITVQPVNNAPDNQSNREAGQTARRHPHTTLATRIARPFLAITGNATAGSVLLILVTAIALIWANSPWAQGYHSFFATEFAVGTPGAHLALSLNEWVNDALMVVFFLVVGMEIKREILVGELSDPRYAMLPIFGAAGGMLVPALIFTLIAKGTAASHGWGIPMATDIAFALGVVTLLGKRVPASLRVFLVALAIVDDLGAVLVIALFYTSTLNLTALLIAALFFLILVGMNRTGFQSLILYCLVGTGLWWYVMASGVHATIAGVLLAITIPAHTRVDGDAVLEDSSKILDRFRDAAIQDSDVTENKEQQMAVFALSTVVQNAQSPLLRLEHILGPMVSLIIMPLFALANAGVTFGGELSALVEHPVVPAVLLGLLVGKPIGIAGAAWLAIRLRFAQMPRGATWKRFVGVAMLGGIGFTMSLFIAGLAFDDHVILDAAKLGIFLGSILSCAGGWLVLQYFSTHSTDSDTEVAESNS